MSRPICAMLLLALCGTVTGQEFKLDLKYRWVYVQTNLLVDKNVQDTLSITTVRSLILVFIVMQSSSITYSVE
jgi:hypothetical protein